MSYFFISNLPLAITTAIPADGNIQSIRTSLSKNAIKEVSIHSLALYQQSYVKVFIRTEQVKSPNFFFCYVHKSHSKVLLELMAKSGYKYSLGMIKAFFSLEATN